jgi:two-component system OmpR family response regulator
LQYDAVVLDAMIPAPDGFEVCRQWRDAGRWMPVLMLTARDAIDDRVRGLDVGADDYLTKPFSFGELFARLRALLRRGPTERPTVLTVGDLEYDPATKVVRRGDVVVTMSAKELALLEYFMRNAGMVLSRTDLIDHVWDFAYDGTSNVVDVYVRYLREKIDRPFGRRSLETIRGSGYRLRADGE